MELNRLYRPQVGLLLILLTTLVVFVPGVTPSFSSDDYLHLSRNLHFESFGDALSVFSEVDDREYRPTVRLSLWLNAQMSDNALAFSATNLLLHLAISGMLYSLLTMLGAMRWPALWGTAIFALHPIHTTSVHFIMGRTDLVATFFYIAALLLALKGWQRQHKWLWVGSLFAGFLALASKELAVTLPVMLLLSIWLIQPPNNLRSAARSFYAVLPMAALVAIYLLLRLMDVAERDVNISGYTQFSITSVLKNYSEWLFALAYPFDLYQARFQLESAPFHFLAMAAPLALISFILLMVAFWPSRRTLIRDPLLWLGIAWIVVTLLPMTGGNAHRWYMYLPSAGLSLMVAPLVQQAMNFPQGRRYFIAALLAAALVVSGWETGRQSLIWHRNHTVSERFFEAVENSNIFEHDEVYLANVPFGYRSTFLFTFRSLEYALHQRYSQSPRIHFASYINLGLDWHAETLANDDGLVIHLEPEAEHFLLLPMTQRRATNMESHHLNDWTIEAQEVTESGHIRRIGILPNTDSPAPLYYYDGSHFKEVSLKNHQG